MAQTIYTRHVAARARTELRAPYEVLKDGFLFTKHYEAGEQIMLFQAQAERWVREGRLAPVGQA